MFQFIISKTIQQVDHLREQKALIRKLYQVEIDCIMNTLVPRQYLVQITLKALICQPSTQTAKVFCEIRYNQSYIKLRTHPLISPCGVANFRKQTLCIPYCHDIAIVFKKNTSSKKELFLGHYKIQVQQYLQRKIYFIEVEQKLNESETYVNFQLRIVDKETFAQSQTEDLSEDESNKQKSVQSVLEHEQPVDMKRHSLRQAQSQYNCCHRTTRSCGQRQNSPFHATTHMPSALPQQFSKKLALTQQILVKKNLVLNQFQRLQSFKRNKKGQLKSQKIQNLQKLLKDEREQYIFNTLMIYVIVALASYSASILLFS